MTTATLRRSGGSLIMTIPLVFAEQNNLSAGDMVDVNIDGPNMVISAKRHQRYSVLELLAATPAEYLVPAWTELTPEGQEEW